jgi:hypothetical protein
MMDKLREFVQQHREEFDTVQPEQGLWNRIEIALQGFSQEGLLRVTGRSWRKMGIAASVVVLIALGFVFSTYRESIDENKVVLELSPRQGTELVRFAGMVNRKREEVEGLSSYNPEMKKEFQEHIEQLGKQYHELREALPNNPNQNDILIEMRKNLQWQMELLERQKEIIDQENQQGEGVVRATANRGINYAVYNV